MNSERAEIIKSILLEEQILGICRRSKNESDLEIMGYYPEQERLKKSNFIEFRDEAWEKAKDDDLEFDFEENMRAEFPELEAHLEENKESNKSEWPKAYERFVQSRPEDIEFVLQASSLKRNVEVVIKKLLPKPIFIPAVKEMDEAIKTSSRGEFGSLLKDLSSEIEEELDEAIDEAMSAVTKKLNISTNTETGEIIDERHFGVKAIEKQITNYLSETFQDFSVALNFPNPRSTTIFSGAEILVKERDQKPLPTNCVGEGVQRVLIFSLFRTLADLRQGKLIISSKGDDEDENDSKPLLILYEESELFLHPGLQKILLLSLHTLMESGDQVIFTTHSPFMIQDYLLKTINLVSKVPENGTQLVNIYTNLNELEPRKKNRLLQIQNISSYVFAERVLLVEGVSDQIILKKLAPALNSDWDFDKCGIPVLQVGGKGNLPLFKRGEDLF